MDKKYTFGVWLDIDAEDEEQALRLFDNVRAAMIGLKQVWEKLQR